MAMLRSSSCPVPFPSVSSISQRVSPCYCKAPQSAQHAPSTTMVQLEDGDSGELNKYHQRHAPSSGASNNVVLLSIGHQGSTRSRHGTVSSSSSSSTATQPIASKTSMEPTHLLLHDGRSSGRVAQHTQQRTQAEIESFNMPATMVARLLAVEKRARALEHRVAETESRATEAEAALFDALQREHALKAVVKQLQVELQNLSDPKSSIDQLQKQVQDLELQMAMRQTDHQAVIFDYNRQLQVAEARKQHDTMVIHNLLCKLARVEAAVFAPQHSNTSNSNRCSSDVHR